MSESDIADDPVLQRQLKHILIDRETLTELLVEQAKVFEDLQSIGFPLATNAPPETSLRAYALVTRYSNIQKRIADVEKNISNAEALVNQYKTMTITATGLNARLEAIKIEADSLEQTLASVAAFDPIVYDQIRRHLDNHNPTAAIDYLDGLIKAAGDNKTLVDGYQMLINKISSTKINMPMPISIRIQIATNPTVMFDFASTSTLGEFLTRTKTEGLFISASIPTKPQILSNVVVEYESDIRRNLRLCSGVLVKKYLKEVSPRDVALQLNRQSYSAPTVETIKMIQERLSATVNIRPKPIVAVVDVGTHSLLALNTAPETDITHLIVADKIRKDKDK